MVKKEYEVILSSKVTGYYHTVIINTINIDKAFKKAVNKYDDKYYIHEVHELPNGVIMKVK